MRTFQDTTTLQYWQFDNDADVRLINGVYQVFDVRGNRIMSVPETLEPVDSLPVEDPALEEVQEQQIAAINAAFEAAAEALTDGYPATERLTWPAQQAEAQAWAANPSAPTPYLDGLAAARGITPEEMRQLTLDQVNLFLAASQQLVGTRQRLRDQINEAETIEAVRAVVWP